MGLTKFKIGLINVVEEGDYQFKQEIPLGLGAIGAFLRMKGYDVEIKQCFASQGEEEYNRTARVEADIYGFQLNMVNYQAVLGVVKKIKSIRPNAITVFGGPFLVSLTDRILNNEPLFDFIVVGEGELTTLELINTLEIKEENFSSIEGLAWRDKSGRIIINNRRGVIEDLDILPFPARDFLKDAEQDQGLTESVRISTSRGCVANCNFCCVNLYSKVQKGKVWRGRSPKHVVDELEQLSKTYGAKLFNFADSSFEDPGREGKIRSRRICEEIIERNLAISAKVYMRCDTMQSDEDKELLQFYKKAGIDIVNPGVEAGSDYELAFLGKRATLEENTRTIRMLQEIGLFYVFPGFIMFTPNSTPETLKTNISYLQSLGYTDNISPIGQVLMLLRDSKIYQMLKLENRLIEEPEIYWKLPRYVFLNPVAERLAQHWWYGRVFSCYPDTLKVNDLQVDIGNLVSRMMNPMNRKVLESLRKEFEELKIVQSKFRSEFGKLQSDYFLKTIELAEKGCSDDELKVSGDKFFGETYSSYLPVYSKVYEDFLNRIKSRNFGLSGIIFKAFHSAMAEKDRKDFSI